MTNLQSILMIIFMIFATLRCLKCELVVPQQITTEKEEPYVHVPKVLYESLIQCVNFNSGNVLEELKQKVDRLIELSQTQNQQNDIQHRFGVLEGKIDSLIGDRNQIFQYYLVLGEVRTRVEELEEQVHVLQRSVQKLQEDNARITEVNSNLTNTIQLLQASTDLHNQRIETVRQRSLVLENTQDEIQRTIENVTDRIDSHEDRFDLVSFTPKEYGSLYVRWGSNTCGSDLGSNSTDLIYAGQVAGSDYQSKGAAVNYLCLPPDPIWGDYDIARNQNGYVFGASIDVWNINVPHTPWDKEKYNMQGVYCAVCRTRGRSSVVMIPGRNECYPGWTLEYHGYLAAGYRTHEAASEYQCLDSQPDIHPISKHVWHKMFYSVEAVCDGPLSCPPYENNKEITCVVCSK